MEQNIQKNQEEKNEKNSTGLIIAIIAAATIILIAAIALVGKIIADKKIAEIKKEAKIAEQIEAEEYAEYEETKIKKTEIEEADEVPEKQIEDTQMPEDTAKDEEAPKTVEDASSAENSELKKMTENEFTLCWYNDKYLSLIPLMGLGTYETIIQNDNFSMGIISGLSKDDIKVYCEHKGEEGDLDLCGFTKGAMVTSEKEDAYSYQVSNKDGITAYISWADGVAAFTVGVE